MIEVENLTKVYGDRTAVDRISFRLPNGHIYGLLGQNGAGKSTTMNMLTGCLIPTSGTVRINGYDMAVSPKQAKRCIGYLPEIPPLYDDMTPEEYLTFVAEAKRMPAESVPSAVRDAMNETMLLSVGNRLIRNLSKGYRQRVGVAGAIVADPDIVILDEPTVGLDPKQIAEIRDLIRKLGKDRTVILSSHILSEISEVCDSILVLANGKLVANDTIESLTRHASTAGSFRIAVKGDEGGVVTAVRDLPGILDVRVTSARDGVVYLTVTADAGIDPTETIYFTLAAKRYVVLSSDRDSSAMENLFFSLTEDGGAAPMENAVSETVPERENESESEYETDTDGKGDDAQ